MTVGGGICSVEDAHSLLRAGADRIAINSAAVRRPELIKEIVKTLGSQCLVLSIEAKKNASCTWEVYLDNGREKTGKKVNYWVKKVLELGVGELMVTSIDQEGTCEGCDIELLKMVTSISTVPVIASGGIGKLDHISDAIIKGGVDAVAMADILHYKKYNVEEIRKFVKKKGFNVRDYETT